MRCIVSLTVFNILLVLNSEYIHLLCKYIRGKKLREGHSELCCYITT